jgi:hypothetical protein
VASGDDAVMRSLGQQEAVAGAGEEVAAGSPPAPAASPKPYYECVFCKRGFTTAQALGGYMNIHRRDRAKPTRESSAPVSRNVAECYTKYRHLYPPTPTSTPMPIIWSSSSSNLYTYYPSSSGIAAAVDMEGVNPSSVSPRELSLFRAAATRDHGLQLGLACQGDAGDGPEGWERQPEEPESELDLELRLGRRPRH